MNDLSVDDAPLASEDAPAADSDSIARLVAEALRRGARPTDRLFDRCLAPDVREVSSRYWTPLVVALHVADWIREAGIETVVDVGSGAGKLCVAAALAGTARFVGIEQRERLVVAARALARDLGVADRVSFVHGTFGEVPVPEANAYYLYNPFGENRFEESERIDSDVELGESRFRRDVGAVERMLREAPVGTCLFTYNGFGGRMPADYEEVRSEDRLPLTLRMWRKVAKPTWPFGLRLTTA